MTPAESVCAWLLVAGLEIAFLVGVALVWRSLARLHVNGPCQLGLALLVMVRLSTASLPAATDSCTGALSWTWLTEALFSFVFLYTLYHMGMLIAACRR